MFDKLGSLRNELKGLLGDLDVEALNGDQAVELLALAVDVERSGAALRLLAARRVKETEVWRRGGFRSAADWMGRRTGTSSSRAEASLETAGRLAACPLVAAAVRAGSMSESQAETIADAVEAKPEVEAELVDYARRHSLRQLRDECRRVKTVGESAEQEQGRLHRSREFRTWIGRDGAWRFSGSANQSTGAELLARVEARREEIIKRARKAGEREPFAAYALDALVELVTEDRQSAQPTRSQPGATVVVHVDYEALLRGHVEDGEVCEVTGLGPVPVSVARRLSEDAILRVLVMKGARPHLVSQGTRRIPKGLRVLLEARDQTCAVPGCDVRKGLEIHHYIEDYSRVQRSSPDRCVRVCKKHHDKITYEGFCLKGDAEAGTLQLIPPSDYRDPEPPDPEMGSMVAIDPWTGQCRNGSEDADPMRCALVGAGASAGP